MLKIEEKEPIEQLRRLSVKLGGNFNEGRRAGLLEIDNNNGKGSIYAYELVEGLSVVSYNLMVKRDIGIRTGGGTDSPIYMICCLKGHYYHSLSGNEGAVRISIGQNLIYAPEDNALGTIELPAHVPLEVCLITINQQKLDVPELKRKSGLEEILEDLYSRVGRSGELTHLQGRGSNVEDYATVLIKNRRTDVIGRLITEAAVLNTMASQLDLQEKHGKNSLEMPPLNDTEMNRVINEVSKMQASLDGKHTIKLFSERSGISPKKIQECFRFVFGRSFAQTLKDMRLELARDLLENSDLPILNIADKVGVTSKSYLSKIFRERFGMNPRDYRDSLINAYSGFELTYQSNASMFIGESDVSSMVEHSNFKNIKNDLTGCLIYYKDNFFQILEGPKREVLETFGKIQKDSRHKEIKVLYKGPRSQRVFGEKGMILLSDKDIATEYSTGRSLSVDLNTLFTDDLDHMALSSKLFWERIRNRILTSEVA